VEALKQIGMLAGQFFRPLAAVLPQLLVVVSLICLLLSKYGTPPVRAFLGPLDPAYIAILGGGFFAWLTKSRLFREAIRDELTTIIYDPKHLQERRDISRLWRNATVAAGLPPHLADLVGDELLRSIWNPKHPYYYVDLQRTHRLSWDGANPNLLLVESQVEGILCCAKPGEVFRKTATLEVESADCVPQTKHSVLKCKTTQQSYSAPFALNPQRPLRYTSEVELPGSPQYSMDECWRFGQLVNHDNLILFQSRVFVRNLTVVVEFDPSTMNVLHKEVGLIELEPLPGSQREHGRLRMRYEGLIPPWSGYTLSVQRT